MFIVYLIEFLVAIGAVIMPLATKLRVKDRLNELSEVFLKWSKVAMALGAVACAFLGVLGPEFVAAWLDEPSYEAPGDRTLPWLMGSCLLFLPARGVALPLLMGLGRAAVPTIGFLAAGVLNLGISVVLAPRYGLTGVALGTAIPNLLYATLIMTVACRSLGIGLGRYMTYVAAKVFIVVLPVLAFLLWLKLGLEVEGRFEVLCAGLATCVLYGILTVLFTYRGDPHVDLRQLLARHGE